MKINRREFIGGAAAGAAALMLPWKTWPAQPAEAATLVVVRGGKAEEAFSAALAALGGLGQFNPANKSVVVKPNIGWDRLPEQAANTDPELVAAAVKALKQSGANVQVFDFTCNTASRCYRRSGIEAAAKDAGAQVTIINEQRFDDVDLPQGKTLNKWPIYRDYLGAELRINMPILKHHSLAGLTMGLKNLMGVMGGERNTIHNGFETKLIDVAAAILPQLTILDARRVLVKNGPQGGDMADVRQMNTLVAGFDPVAVDAEGARIFGMDPANLKYLVEAEKRGLGRMARPSGFREIELG